MSKRKNKKKKKNSFFKTFFLILIIISIVAGVRLGVGIYLNGGGLEGFLITTFGGGKKLEDLDTIYVLLMGVSTDLKSELTDTLMVCGYNPKTDEAMMLSIPRDTFIGKNKNRAKGSDKINYLYSKGPEETLEAVREITGIDIKYYAIIKNDVLIKIVDVIGGVQFNVPINMKYDDPTQNLHINLKKGMQTINGEKAEQLLRFRHNNDGSTYPTEYGDNDYGRMRTQREFIKATISQTIKFKNITKINSIMKTIFDNLETNLSMEELLSYVPYASNIDLENLSMEQLPGQSELCNEVWIYIHDEEETEKLVDSMVDRLENGVPEVAEDENTSTNTSETVTSNASSNTATNTVSKSKK